MSINAKTATKEAPPKDIVASLFGLKQPKHRKEILGVEGSTEKGNVFLGMEIEVERCEFRSDTYQEMLSPAWEVKTDNSLRNVDGLRAWEFVTVPLTYEQMLAEVERFYATTEFSENNFSDRCSIHVHANVTDFKINNLSALALLYQSVEDVLFSFVGRDRDTNLYCIPWSQCRMNYELLKHFKSPEEAHRKLRSWQKYTALNLLPITTQGTVEFRHMHGSADVRKISQWVTIINRLITAAKNQSLDDTIKQIKELSDNRQYEGYFNSFFDGVIQFTPAYQEALDTGIINAKYSMMNLSKKPAPRTTHYVFFDEANNFGEARERQRQIDLDMARLDVTELAASVRATPRWAASRQTTPTITNDTTWDELVGRNTVRVVVDGNNSGRNS